MRRAWTSLVLLAACGDDSNVVPPDAMLPPGCPVSGTTVRTRMIAQVLDAPMLVTSPIGDPRLFVVERDGTIQIIENEVVRGAPFLDIRDNNGGPVVGGGERGLLGLAFHPDYRTNRRFYVYYTAADPATPDTGDGFNVVAEYLASQADPYVADAASARVVLSIPDFAGNHNGGMIEFGDDGLLYIGTGDGGGGGDPDETGQDDNSLLGKILRIDVDGNDAGQYGIPPGNPFAAGGGAPEIFIKGLRNPWRFGIDRVTDTLFIGDVGQGAVEEVSVVAIDEAAGVDFGWDDCEGSEDFEGGGCASPTEPARRRPVYEEKRTPPENSDWCSVIGGEVYRGGCFPDLAGRYFFTDYCPGGLWSFVYDNGVATDVIHHGDGSDFSANPTSIHADSFGELYITSESGEIERIEVAP
jgi:glucose/arabinose dehydrogenase